MHIYIVRLNRLGFPKIRLVFTKGELRDSKTVKRHTKWMNKVSPNDDGPTILYSKQLV